MLRHGPKHSTQRPWGHLRSLQRQRKMHGLWRTRTQKPHHEAVALASWRRLDHFHWTRDFSRVLGHSLPTTLEAVTMGRRPADSHEDTTRPLAFASTVPNRHASACGLFRLVSTPAAFSHDSLSSRTTTIPKMQEGPQHTSATALHKSKAQENYSVFR